MYVEIKHFSNDQYALTQHPWVLTCISSMCSWQVRRITRITKADELRSCVLYGKGRQDRVIELYSCYISTKSKLLRILL